MQLIITLRATVESEAAAKVLTDAVTDKLPQRAQIKVRANVQNDIEVVPE